METQRNGVGRGDQPLGETELAALSAHRCPICLGRIVTGPQGGMSINLACGVCGVEVNATFIGGEAAMAHWNSTPGGEPDRQRLREVFGIVLPTTP